MAKTITFKNDFESITLKNNSKTITFKNSFDSIIFDVIQQTGIGIMKIEVTFRIG